MPEFIYPPQEFSDPTVPVVFFAGHEAGHDWQTPLAHKLIASSQQFNIASSRRPDGPHDTMTQIEDAGWALRHMRAVLGGTGVLAVNLEPFTVDEEKTTEQVEFFGINRALSGVGAHNGTGRHIVIRVAPGYSGNEAYLGYLAGETGAQLVTQEAEFIAQILSRLHEFRRSAQS